MYDFNNVIILVNQYDIVLKTRSICKTENFIIILSFVLLFGSVSFAYAAVPSAPTLVTADGKHESAKLEWRTPSYTGGSGSPITHYVIEYHAFTETPLFEPTSTTSTTATVFNLTNEKLYAFRVAAVNTEGQGVFSNIIWTIPAKHGPPGKPQDLQLTLGYKSVTLDWNMPYKRNPIPYDYQVWYKQSGSNWARHNTDSSTQTSATITGLIAGYPHLFQVRAVNDAGPGPWTDLTSIVPIGEPGPPTNLTTTSGNTQVKLSWHTPISNGADRVSCGNISCVTFKNTTPDPSVTDYTIQYSTDGTSWSTFIDAKTTKTSTTVTGLENGTTYQFRVYAENSVGTSEPSRVISATPKGPPDAPKILRVESSVNSVHLWWNEPHDGGLPITDYIIQYGYNSNWLTHDNHGIDTTTTITDLESNTTYQFRIYAVNSDGRSDSSNIVSATTTTEQTIPNKPTNLRAIHDNQIVELEWDPLIYDPPITDYIIQYRSSNSWMTFNDGTNNRPSAIVTGLTNGTTYEFRVSAVNSEGIGEPSSVVSATPSTIPDSPTSLTATSSNTRVNLSWFAPTNNGGAPITDYVIEYSSNGTTWLPFNDRTSTLTTAVVTGLTNGTAYEFRVSAVNSNGTGESSSVSSTPHPTVPGKPTFQQIRPGDGKIDLSWSVPNNGGLPISHYILEYRSGSSWSSTVKITVHGTSTTVTGLDHAAYFFKISAVNSVGVGSASNTISVTVR